MSTSIENIQPQGIFENIQTLSFFLVDHKLTRSLIKLKYYEGKRKKIYKFCHLKHLCVKGRRNWNIAEGEQQWQNRNDRRFWNIQKSQGFHFSTKCYLWNLKPTCPTEYFDRAVIIIWILHINLLFAFLKGVNLRNITFVHISCLTITELHNSRSKLISSCMVLYKTTFPLPLPFAHVSCDSSFSSSL